MRTHAPLAALLLLAASLSSCENEERAQPQTPEEMYAEAQRLLKPHVEGEQSDYAAANRLLHEAAERGFVQAQTDLGGMYLSGGQGVEPNGREALRWFLRAVEQGHVASHIFIGDIYRYGLSGRRDDKAALEHWKIAAEAGYPEAQLRLGNALVAQGEQLAEGIEWLTRATQAPKASASSAAAAYALGIIHAKGKGVPADMAEATRWYALAAAGGNARAQHIYALMLLTGEGVEKDISRGESLLRLAAGQGYARAAAALVNWLRNKEGATEAEQAEAEAWAGKLDEMNKAAQAAQPAQP